MCSRYFLIIIVLLSSACAFETNDADQKKTNPETTKNKWIPLFNGHSLEGWTIKFAGHDINENYKNTFQAKNGILKVSYDKYEKFDKNYGHIFYNQIFSNYILRLEYRFTGEQTPGGANWAYKNSGIMIHSQSPASMEIDQYFPTSIEVQLLGGNGTAARPTGNVCTPGTHIEIKGKLIKEHCINSTSKTFHDDQWVTVEVEVRNNTIIRHKINGELVFEYTAPQLDYADNEMPAQPSTTQPALTKGYISLQAESHPVEFRKIILLNLDPANP